MSTATPSRLDSSQIGKTIRFKGNITGAEDIFIDGEVEGSIQLPGQLVTVGPNGAVNADIAARELVVQGKVKGNAKAQDRIEVSRTGSVLGDLAMARISIQDGAFIQGRVDIQATASGPAAPAPRPVAAAAPAPAGTPITGTSSPAPAQASLLDRKP